MRNKIYFYNNCDFFLQLKYNNQSCLISGIRCTRRGTENPVLSGHSKIDKTKIMTNDSLMKVESIAECSPLEHSAIFLTCIKR